VAGVVQPALLLAGTGGPANDGLVPLRHLFGLPMDAQLVSVAGLDPGRAPAPARARTAVARAFQYVRPGGRLLIACRNAQRLTSEGGRDAAEAWLTGLLEGCDTAEVSFTPTADDDPGICAAAVRAGIHQPAAPWEWVDDPARFTSVCAELNRAPVVALDVETTLEEPRRLCTVQLGVRGQTYIVDALALEDLAPLKTLLENDAVEVVIHNAFFEEHILGRLGIRITNVFDTLPASRKKHGTKVRGTHKLGDVCERELGLYLDKKLQVSDWTRRPLDPAQLAYAAIDAEVLIDLYDVFKPPPEPEHLELFPA